MKPSSATPPAGDASAETPDRPWADPRPWFVLGLGFSSGLPFMLTTSTLQAWLHDYGIGLKAIGASTLFALPYTFKFLWAPLVDRYVPPLLGRRRGWIALMQFLLALTMVQFASVNPAHQHLWVAAVVLSLAFFSATQDIAVDAYRVDLLPPKWRGPGSAATVSGYRIANVVSGALALIAVDHVGWRVTFLSLAALMAACSIIAVAAPEPEIRQALPRSFEDVVVRPFIEFFHRSHAWGLLVLVAVYKLGDALLLILSTPYLRSLGFSNSEVGYVSKGLGLAATLFGAFLGGALSRRWGMYRALLVLGLVQSLTVLSYAWLDTVGYNQHALEIAIFVQCLGDGMGTAAFMAFLLSLCDKRFGAFQYALFSAAFSGARVFFGLFAGALAENAGWQAYFGVSCVLGLLGVALVRLLREPIQLSEEGALRS